MSLRLLNPGMQTTLQGAPRHGLRHMGVPTCGPADPLSMALANRLVGNSPSATALEITFGPIALEFTRRTVFALTGAPASFKDAVTSLHTTLIADAGQVLQMDQLAHGARVYLAVAGGFAADLFLGSTSTYMPAGFGGHQGRALKQGDALNILPASDDLPRLTTPDNLQLSLSSSFALRTVPSAEFHQLAPASAQALFDQTFTASAQITRMGIALDGPVLDSRSDGKMKSAPVFPGTLQCPENGQPIILLPDAGTTGGYPRIASVARCDQHLLGQIRPRNKVRFLQRTATQAREDYAAKSALFQRWLPDFTL